MRRIAMGLRLLGAMTGAAFMANAGCQPTTYRCEHPAYASAPECSLGLHCPGSGVVDLRAQTSLLLEADEQSSLWFTRQTASQMSATLQLRQHMFVAQSVEVIEAAHQVSLHIDPQDLTTISAPRGGEFQGNVQIAIPGPAGKSEQTPMVSCRAVVTPLIGSSRAISYPDNLLIDGTLRRIDAPVAVQIGAPDGSVPALFVTENYLNGGQLFDYLERYLLADPSSPRRQSPTWFTNTNKQGNLPRSSSPLFALASGTLLVYAGSAGNRDLTTVSVPSGLTVNGWRATRAVQTLPTDAIRLAAAADGDWLFLGQADQVQAFRLKNTSGAVSGVEPLGTATASSLAVLTARASGQPPMPGLPQFDALAVSAANDIKLLKSELPDLVSQCASKSATKRLQDKLNSSTVRDAALVDLNEDGLQDLLILPASGGELLWAAQRIPPRGSDVAGCDNNPEQTLDLFDELISLTPVPAGALGVAAGDLTGDGLPELAVPVGPTGAMVQIYSLTR